MTNNSTQKKASWTEADYSPLCISPYISTPLYVPDETTFFICRDGEERKPARMTFVVFKSLNAPDDEWEDDPMPGTILAEVLGDGDEEVSPVQMTNIGMRPDEFLSVVRDDDREIVFDLSWDEGTIRVDKARLTDEGYVIRKDDFGDDGVRCVLTPDGGEPFELRLVIPFVGFSIADADGNMADHDITITHEQADTYTYAFVGDGSNDRFSVLLDGDKLNYLCVLRDDGTMAVRDMRDRLAEVGQIPERGTLTQLLMGAHDALIKNKNNRWRVTLEGNGMDDASDLKCDPVELSRFAFTKFSECDKDGEDDLAHRLMAMEQRMAFQWYWLNEHDWSHEHMDGLIDMEGIDADPEKMMRQALLFNRFESFMKRLTAFSYVSQKPIQGDQLQARNNKRKIARCAKRVLAHRAGTESIWGLDEEARREILHFSATFHREFTAALEELGA